MSLLTCRNDAERGRLLDLSRRLRPAEVRGAILLAIAALIGGPTFGWLAALPPLPGIVVFFIIQRRLERFRRPELALIGCVALTQAGLAGSIAMAQGPRIYLLSLLMLILQLACIVFPVRMAIMTMGYSAALMVAVAFSADRALVVAHPFYLLFPLAVMISAGFVAMVVASLDVNTRGVATLDQLTQLPNRMALRARAAELEYQAAITGRPVALIVGDPDRFKAINDSHGHAAGDAVLHEVAARISGCLPAGAGAYRLGGEEFVVFLSDADEHRAAAVAEQIRRAVDSQPIADIDVAISLGVAASAERAGFDFSTLFGRADAALYEVKRKGGDAVRVHSLSGLVRPLSDAERRRAERLAGRQEAAATRTGTDGDPDGAQTSSFERQRARNGSRAPAAESEEGAPQLNGDLLDAWARWNEREHASSGNWLIRDDLARRQLLQLNLRLREHAKPAFVLGFIVGSVSAVDYGWQILIPPAIGTLAYIATEHVLERLHRPEFALGLAWMIFQGGFMASGLIANHQMVFAAPLLFMLLVGSSAVFPPRGVAIGVAYTVAIMFVVGFVEAPQLVSHAPAILAFLIANTAVIGMLGVAIGRSTIEYRDLAIIDQLTGLFNRAALATRVAELAHRSGAASSPVALLVADIDNFKAVNDNHGHAVGDAVLREVAARLRSSLRAFESAYRIGGEEFLVLLEDVDWSQAERVALRVCAGVAERPIAGVQVTISVGLAASAPGEVFDYEPVFRRADAALYEAKHKGGNCACSARRHAGGHAGRNGGGPDVLGPSALSIAPIAPGVALGT